MSREGTAKRLIFESDTAEIILPDIDPKNQFHHDDVPRADDLSIKLDSTPPPKYEYTLQNSDDRLNDHNEVPSADLLTEHPILASASAKNYQENLDRQKEEQEKKFPSATEFLKEFDNEK